MIDATTRNAVMAAVERAVQRTRADIDSGESENEVDTTSRHASRIKDEINALELPSDVRVSAQVRTLQDRGPGAAEARYGADLLIVLRIETAATQVTKGALVQAKRSGHEGVGLQGESRVSVSATQAADRLRTQCAKMTRLSAESFVWVYGDQGFRSARATAVAEVRGTALTVVRSAPVEQFFGEMMDCSIGDVNLSAIDNETLERLRDQVDAVSALAIEIVEGDVDRAFTPNDSTTAQDLPEQTAVRDRPVVQPVRRLVRKRTKSVPHLFDDVVERPR